MTDPLDSQEEFLNKVCSLALRLNAAQVFSSGQALGEELPDNINKQQVSQALESAETEIKKPTVKKNICEALKSTGDDLKEVSKVVGAALLPLAMTGVVALPLTPLAFAVAALLIYRAGISAYCSQFEKK